MEANNRISIRMLGKFDVMVGDKSVEKQLAKTKKGTRLLQYLVLRGGESAPNFKLYEVLWEDEQSSNPEGALKTLVSRTRTILSEIAPELGEAIVTERGSYRFNTSAGISVDTLEFEKLTLELNDVAALDDETHAKFNRMLSLFQGDLLPGLEQEDWVVSRSVYLHSQYLKMVYKYLDLLKEAKDFERMIHVCRLALDVDVFDERLHLALMNALIRTNRNNEALIQYKHATNLHLRYLGMQPPEAIQEFYKQILKAGKTLDMDIDAIRKELTEYGSQRGAFVCEYAVFKEIYNLQMRNLERMGSTMFIALIMVTSIGTQQIEPMRLNDIMQTLQKTLTSNLRKGDTITHFSASQYALLLPLVNHDTGKMVLERIKRAFYKACPNSAIMFSYRLGPISLPSQPQKSGLTPRGAQPPQQG
jgi:DNA-binding SARP family transcriptional activator